MEYVKCHRETHTHIRRHTRKPTSARTQKHVYANTEKTQPHKHTNNHTSTRTAKTPNELLQSHTLYKLAKFWVFTMSSPSFHKHAKMLQTHKLCTNLPEFREHHLLAMKSKRGKLLQLTKVSGLEKNRVFTNNSSPFFTNLQSFAESKTLNQLTKFSAGHRRFITFSPIHQPADFQHLFTNWRVSLVAWRGECDRHIFGLQGASLFPQTVYCCCS